MFPAIRLAPTNTLETVFIYDPGEVGCQSQPKPISVQVQGDSSLTWQGNQDATGKLSDLPHHVLQPGQVIVDTQHIAHGIPTLWITRIGQADQVDLVKQLSLALANPRTPWATHLSGNVVTLTDFGGIQSWNVSEGGLQTNAIASTDSPLFLQRYGSLLFTLALISGGVAAWSTYQRLGRPPQMISHQPFPSETTQDSEKR